MGGVSRRSSSPLVKMAAISMDDQRTGGFVVVVVVVVVAVVFFLFFCCYFFLIIFFCPTFLFGLVKKKNSLVALERGWIDETQCPDTEREFCFRASPLTAPTPLLTSLLIHSHANVSKKKIEQKLIV